MFFTRKPNSDTAIDHIEMALRGGYRKAREFIPKQEFVENPRKVDEIIFKHIRALLGPLYPNVACATDLNEAFTHKSVWLIDSFDGPMNEREQGWFGASTIALVQDDEVTAAGVYDIAHDRVFTASIEDGRYVIDADGMRSWLRVTGDTTQVVEIRKPRCLQIMDVICGPRAVFRAPCDDSIDFIAAAFIARNAGCIVTDYRGAPWHYASSDIVVASDKIAHAHAEDTLPAHA